MELGGGMLLQRAEPGAAMDFHISTSDTLKHMYSAGA